MGQPNVFRRIPLRPLAGLGLVVVAGIATILLSFGVHRLNQWVAHSIRTQVGIVAVSEKLTAFESGFRGFLIRKSPDLLGDAYQARGEVLRQLDWLDRETADNPVQRRNARILRGLIMKRLASGQALIDLRMTQGIDMMPARPTGRLIMAPIRTRIAAMFAEEDRLRAIRQRWLQVLTVGLALFLVGAAVAVLVVAYLTAGDAAARYRALEQAHEEAGAETARREAVENELRHMQKMETIGQLTGGIAHDFNNMLAVVIGSLDMAERKAVSDPAHATRCITTARDGAERAAALVGRLLAFARRQSLVPEPLDANALIAGMSELLSRTLGEQVAVETTLAADPWRCFADAGQLENTILNLAVNARDAMAGGDGRLTVATANVTLRAGEGSTLAPGDYVRVSVADTGRGMAPEVIERAFDPFFTTKEIGKGTGLGLSQVFGFARQSGGDVSIVSTPGRGTTVALHLPRHHGPGMVPEVRHKPGTVDARAGEIVLVAEDEPHVRHFSAEALEELGYTVLTADDGEQALRMIERRPEITLLFTDVMMPGMTGRALADAARRLRPSMPVLFTTGYAPETLAEGAKDGDAPVALLRKPFTIGQLAAKVRAAIDG